jgi:hypothetical protein
LLLALLAVGASAPAAPGEPPRVTVPDAPSPPAPVAWWRFEETGGSIAYDSSGHGTHAAIRGAARIAVPGGHALQFDGGGHVVADGPVVHTDEAFTITAWVRLDALDDWGTVVSEHAGARAPDVILLDYDHEHTDWAFMFPDRDKGWAQGDETVFSGRRPVRGRWTHLAAVFAPGDRRACVYVDGALEACRTRAAITRAPGPLEIGRALADGEPVDGWHGAIDDTRVFARALTRAQIKDIAAHRA